MGVASGFWSWSNDFSRECLALVADRSLSGGRVTRELYAERLMADLAREQAVDRHECRALRP
jgi:hypothetical protein